MSKTPFSTGDDKQDTSKTKSKNNINTDINKDTKNQTIINESIDDKYEFPSNTEKLTRSSEKYKDDGTDKAFKNYDQNIDKTKYPVYRNDIKFKQHRNVDPSRAVWSEDVKNDFHNKDTDSIEYRIEECAREKDTMLDLSHMDEKCFDDLFKNKKFLSIISKVQHLFAKDCKLRKLPNLKCMTGLLTLDISCNKITELPELPLSIEELIVNDNRLTLINNNMPNLLRFNCDNNNIKQITFSPTLQRIHVVKNPINEIPDLKELYYLDASSTQIKHIGSFPKLKHLSVSSTKITTIKNLESLEYLQCNSSDVKYISNIPKIQSIEMVDTQIDCLPFMQQLYRVTYTQSNRFKLSKKYKIHNVKKNKNNVNEIVFKTN
jgi:hypothetical protein